MPAEKFNRHSLFEDAQALLVAPMFVAFAVLLFQQAGLLAGGTVGLAFLIHYASGWSMAWVVFLLNIPFYLFSWRAMGTVFTVKTFLCVGLLALYTAFLPQVITLQSIDRLFAAVMGGFLIGVGLLMIIRHQASLGGMGVLAIYLQNTRGWPAGKVQMAMDFLILMAGLVIRDPQSVGLSIVGALALNLVLAANHKAGRYQGT